MDRKLLLAWGTVVATGLLVAGLGGCGIGVRHVVEDATTLAEPISAVRLDGDWGGVRIDGRPGVAAARLERSIRTPDSSAPGPTHRVEDGTLVLSGCGRHCSVDYTVTVPPGLPVSGGTSSGAVALTGVGSVDVHTDSGRVDLDDVAGPTTVRTTNGALRGTGLRGGQTEVTTSNGTIDLTLQTAQGVRAGTSNGGITLTVPDGSYRVRTRTAHGDERIGVPDEPGAAHLLDLTTSNGDITVRRG